MAEICASCQKLLENWQKLARINFNGILSSSINIKDIKINASNGCRLCAMIYGSLSRSIRTLCEDGKSIQDLRLQVDLRGSERLGSKYYNLTLEEATGSVGVCIFPSDDQPLVKPSDLSSRTDSDQSLSLAYAWLQRCSEDHNCLSNSLKAFPDGRLPSRLISLRNGRERLCLTNALPSSTQYITLSHCWGLAKQFTLQHDNINALQEFIPLHLLSKTFRDAIFLTRRFGYEYLWIDSLCIIQDSTEDWSSESSTMASVYGRSSLNLAASYAKDGTVGCFVDRDPACIVPCEISLDGPGLPGMAQCMPADFYHRQFWDTALSHRAWAFQERFLSPRTLFFGESQIFWGCQQLEACESFPISIPPLLKTAFNLVLHDNGATATATLDSLLGNRPGIWSDIVLAYSAGLLTRQDDKLIAVSGVARLRHQLYPDTYLAGLWRTGLEWQLLWRVNSENRGLFVGASKELQLRDKQAYTYRAPSWSWAAVNGDIRQLFPDISTSVTSRMKSCIKVISVTTTLLNDENPFGAVTAGRLRISTCGLMVVANAYGHTTQKHLIRVEKLDIGSFEETKDFHMIPLWDHPGKTYARVYFCRTWSMIPRYNLAYGLMGGLLLTPTSNRNEYMRVGRADSYNGTVHPAPEYSGEHIAHCANSTKREIIDII